MSENSNHKIFMGADYDALQPWFTAYVDIARKIDEVSTHALSRRDSAYELNELIQALIENRQPVAKNPRLELCPETLLMLPTLMRDAAGMVEDLIERIGVKPAKQWEPNKNGTP